MIAALVVVAKTCEGNRERPAVKRPRKDTDMLLIPWSGPFALIDPGNLGDFAGLKCVFWETMSKSSSSMPSIVLQGAGPSGSYLQEGADATGSGRGCSTSQRYGGMYDILRELDCV